MVAANCAAFVNVILSELETTWKAQKNTFNLMVIVDV
jgi:hypothetical protein